MPMVVHVADWDLSLRMGQRSLYTLAAGVNDCAGAGKPNTVYLCLHRKNCLIMRVWQLHGKIKGDEYSTITRR